MGDFLAIPGSTFSRDKTGIRRVELFFVIEVKESEPEPWDLLDSYLPPDLPFGLPPVDRKASKLNDGAWQLTIAFEGVPQNYTFDGSDDQAEIDDSSVEDPIESFPKFLDLVKKYKGILSPDTGNLEKWTPKIKDPASGQTVRNPLLGFSHYLNPQPVLRSTFTLKGLDTSWLRNMGKIDQPRVPAGFEALLTKFDPNKTWLKRSVKILFKGNCWQYVIEWVLGIWIPDVYAPEGK